MMCHLRTTSAGFTKIVFIRVFSLFSQKLFDNAKTGVRKTRTDRPFTSRRVLLGFLRGLGFLGFFFLFGFGAVLKIGDTDEHGDQSDEQAEQRKGSTEHAEDF